MGGEIQAIKIVVVACFILIVVAISIYYKVKIPALRFEAISSHYESVKSHVKQAKQMQKKTLSEQKTHISLETTTPQQPPEQEKKSLLKSILKDKLASKIQQKEDEQTIRNIHVTFPTDKPTFPLDLLDKNLHQGPSLDEDMLMEKAEAIKNKLAEFDIDVSIE